MSFFRWMHTSFGWFGALVMSTIAAGAFLFVIIIIVQGQSRNREAIRVSCQLLANTITQSGAGSSQGPARRDNRPTPQVRLTLAYRAHLESTMTPRERATVTRLKREVALAGGGVTVPDCARIARDPASVQAAAP